jgi:chemotaxis protein CheZ
MDAAERITSLAGDADTPLRDGLIEQVTRIFEACGFQDITGQRVSKVVAVLQHIEQRLADLAGPGVTPNGSAKSMPPIAASAADPARPDGAFDEPGLLNGPQLPGKASSQADIDEILAATGTATND